MARPRGARGAAFAEAGAELGLSLRNVYETLEISAPTVVQAVRGTLTKGVCDLRLESWSRKVVENARIALDVRGREHLEPGHTYLVMSNHQSLYDIPVLFHVIGPNVRMITKKELFAIPIFGGALAAAGFVSIDRSDRAHAIQSLQRARELLASGTHVWISPEGTRSQDGKLLPFKKGAFYLAFEALLPILPVTLRGTRDVLAAHGVLSVAGAAVTVTIHERIDPTPYAARGADGRQELMNHLRDVLASAL
jgi:1-acyl-sn-glycerol-3-phosphate acyltransferase